ncbi:MAG: hypothetical protein J5620_00620 [Alphaproteobacteria bacterium]|nr:hypothetical protein [Alphaproteobacteria bacterium]
MENKRTLIFDASVIAENLNNGRGRSGIYFATYNILKNLMAQKKFDVSLYSSYFDDRFDDFVKQNFGSVRVYYDNRYTKFLSKMVQLDKRLRASKHNITKLLLNVFVRKPLKFSGYHIRIPNFDVAFSPIYVFPKKIKAKEKYIFLHDTIPVLFPDYYSNARSKNHYWFDGLVQYVRNAKNTCKYFANSAATKNDFVQLFNVNSNDIKMVPLAANDNFYHVTDDKQIAAARAKYNIPTDKKYVFSLCTLEPRKNLIRAVKTFIEFIKKN